MNSAIPTTHNTHLLTSSYTLPNTHTHTHTQLLFDKFSTYFYTSLSLCFISTLLSYCAFPFPSLSYLLLFIGFTFFTLLYTLFYFFFICQSSIKSSSGRPYKSQTLRSPSSLHFSLLFLIDRLQWCSIYLSIYPLKWHLPNQHTDICIVAHLEYFYSRHPLLSLYSPSLFGLWLYYHYVSHRII